MNLSLSLNFKTIWPIVRAAQIYVFGLLLVGTFAYTAYVVNASLNVKPAVTAPDAASTTTTKIIFDKQAISSLKNLSSVNGDVPTGNLGTTDPFR